MGLLFNSKEDVKKDVEARFGQGKNFLLAIKHNGPLKSGIELLVSNVLYTYDNNRTFILVFDAKGIYEKEISNSNKTNFYLMPESEIQNFQIDKKPNKAYIHFEHLGKKVSYEIPFKGKIFKKNEKNFLQVQKDIDKFFHFN